MKMWLAIAFCIAAAQAYSKCGTMKDPAADQTNGTVRIPLVFPNKYAGGLKCSMKIPAKDGYHIKMVLKRMHTEEHNDELKILYKEMKRGRERSKLQYFSGYHPASVMPKTHEYPVGSGLDITFKTSAWHTATGFEFTWEYVREAKKEETVKKAKKVLKESRKVNDGVKKVAMVNGLNNVLKKVAKEVRKAKKVKTVKEVKEVLGNVEEVVKDVRNEKSAHLMDKAAKAVIEAAQDVKEAAKVVKVAAEEARAKNVRKAKDPNCGSMTTPDEDQSSGTVRVPLAYPRSYATNLNCQMKIPGPGDGYHIKIVLKRLKTVSLAKLNIYYKESGAASRWGRKKDISFSGSPKTPQTRTYPSGAGVELEFRTSRYAPTLATGFELTWEYTKE